MFDSSVATRCAVPFVVDFNSSMVDFVSLASIVVRSMEFCRDSQVLMK
jgi:hypothetical protein